MENLFTNKLAPRSAESHLLCLSCIENLHKTTCVWQRLDAFLANKYESEDMQQTIRVTPDPRDRSATLPWNLPMDSIPQSWQGVRQGNQKPPIHDLHS